MAKNIRSKALGFSSLIFGAALMVGCQSAMLSEVEAAEVGSRELEPSIDLIEVAPADRKFFDQGYLYGWGSLEPAAEENQIHPADIKFFEPGATVVEQVHPADVKFYNWSSVDEIDLEILYDSLHPADRKFLGLVGAR